MSYHIGASARLAAVLTLGAGGCGLFPTESDDSVERAAVPLTVVFPDTVAAGERWGVEAYFMAGTNLCWRLRSVEIGRDGSTFLVAGTSINPSPGGVCPTAIAFDWADVVGPAVGTGDYSVDAGDLRGSLTVRGHAESARRAILSQGWVGADSTAWWFQNFTHRYRVENPELLSGAGEVRIEGTVDSLRAEGIKLERIQYLGSTTDD